MSIDLFGQATLPREGIQEVRILDVETVTSPTKGVMRRLVAEVCSGPDAGARVWKPLTADLKGMQWMERALAAAGLRVSFAPTGSFIDRAAAALIMSGRRLRADVYRYVHASGEVYPTIRRILGPAA